MNTRLWGWPVALGLLCASGLVSALVADGWGDAWSWFALGLPPAIALRHALRPSRRMPDSRSHPPQRR